MKYQLKCRTNNNDIVNLIIRADNEDQAIKNLHKQYKNAQEVISINDNPTTISHSLAKYKTYKDKLELHTDYSRNAYPYIVKNQRGKKQNIVAIYT